MAITTTSRIISNSNAQRQGSSRGMCPFDLLRVRISLRYTRRVLFGSIGSGLSDENAALPAQVGFRLLNGELAEMKY